MKKKTGIILFLILLLSLTAFLLIRISGSLITDNVSFTFVERGSFRKEYRTSAVIKGINHYYYFNGIITDCTYEENDFIEAGQVILTYLNGENKKTELKSTVSGYLTELSAGRVVVCDQDYRLVCYLPADKYDLLSDDAVCLFEYGDESCEAKVSDRKDLAEKRAGQTVYQVTLEPEIKDDLKLNRQGNLTIPLKAVSNVLKVDRKALVEDAEGYYLMDSAWINSIGNPERYRIRVEVIMADENTAVINGVELENRKVCIIDDNLKAVLDD